jgi:FAD:protein FMN transferase
LFWVSVDTILPAVKVPRANLKYNNLIMKRLKAVYSIVLVLLLAAGTVLLVVFLSSRQGGSSEPKDTYHSPTIFAMDTTLDITIQSRSTAQAEADVNAAVKLAREIEAHTSRFKAGSDVSNINANAGVAPVSVHADTMFMVQSSLDYTRATNGAFDITVAPIAELWGFYSQNYRVPTKEEINNLLPLVDYKKVQVDPANSTVMLVDKGMQIDLGGIAKGYAVEQMYNLLKTRGVKHAVINFGGAVGALGKRADGKEWVVGIKHPRDGGGQLLGELHVSNNFVSSSGDYERYFIKDGTRYCHILDPATGYQPRQAMSTTVVGPDSTADDMLSTALFVMGPDKGLEFMKSRSNTEALIVGSAGKVYFTPNMKTKYVIEVPENI